MASNEDIILKEIDRVLDNYVDRVFELAIENLNTPHVKKFKSGRSKSIITTDKGLLSQTGNVNRSFLNKAIVFPARYADHVEFGNIGQPVDFKDIREWVGRKVLKGKKYSTKTVNRITFDIIKQLESRGQSPDPFLQPAINKANLEFGFGGVNNA